MADSEYVQLAKRWILEPLQCTTFLAGLIQEFESLFKLKYEPESDGEFTATVEKTENYRRSLATSLSKNINLAYKALTLCSDIKAEVFRLDARWQEVFSNFERTIINRNVSAILGKPAIQDAEEELGKAFNAFRRVVTDLNERIAVSDVVSSKVVASKTGPEIQTPERSAFADIEDALSGQQLKLFKFLALRKHPTSFDSIRDECACFRESSTVTDQTVFEALKRLQKELGKIRFSTIRLMIEKTIGRTQLHGLDEFKARGKTGGK